jgi:NADH-quinone oxidoreductase subunit M
VVGATGVILAAVYLLWAYQRAFHGEPDEENAATPDLSWREGLVLAPLLAGIVFLGIYPRPVLERMEPAVDRLLQHVEDRSGEEVPRVTTEGPEAAAATEREAP